MRQVNIAIPTDKCNKCIFNKRLDPEETFVAEYYCTLYDTYLYHKGNHIALDPQCARKKPHSK